MESSTWVDIVSVNLRDIMIYRLECLRINKLCFHNITSTLNVSFYC